MNSCSAQLKFESQLLLLASKSVSRRNLLEQARIPFQIIGQEANEFDCDWTLPLEALVVAIALYKMKHAQLPEPQDGQVIYVLTADTLSQNKNNKIHAKPLDKDDAIAQIKALSGKSRVSTGFCLEKRRGSSYGWITENQVIQAVTAECFFEVPDDWIEDYVKYTGLLDQTGALTIEGFGMQFVKELHGSYSAILGLPLYELRQALFQMQK